MGTINLKNVRTLRTKIDFIPRCAIKVGRAKLNARWLREHFQHDIADDLPFVACPTRVVTGQRDIQVLPDDERKIAGLVKGPAQRQVMDDMTHLLRRTSRPMTMLSLMKIYRQQIKEPVDAHLVELIESWMDSHFPGRREAAPISRGGVQDQGFPGRENHRCRTAPMWAQDTFADHLRGTSLLANSGRPSERLTARTRWLESRLQARWRHPA